MQHRPKAWDRQAEAYTYWRERDHCGWNGRLTKPQRPETNIIAFKHITRYSKKRI